MLPYFRKYTSGLISASLTTSEHGHRSHKRQHALLQRVCRQRIRWDCKKCKITSYLERECLVMFHNQLLRCNDIFHVSSKIDYRICQCQRSTFKHCNIKFTLGESTLHLTTTKNTTRKKPRKETYIVAK